MCPNGRACISCTVTNPGLTAHDKREIDGFLDGLRRERLRLVAPIEGTHNEFCSRPAFGQSCATEDWTAEDLTAKED